MTTHGGDQWASQFVCPNDGRCTDAMVTTKKTCAKCGATLIRDGMPPSIGVIPERMRVAADALARNGGGWRGTALLNNPVDLLRGWADDLDAARAGDDITSSAPITAARSESR